MATWGELEKAGTKWRDLEEMTWGELEEFCVINPKTKQIPDDMEVSFVPMQSVSDTGAVQTDEVRKASEVKKGFTFFEEGDVLFAKITPCMENGKGGIARGLKNGVGFGSTEFHVLHPAPEKVSSEWLYYLTSWDEFRKQCARNMTGSAGQKRVPKSYLEHYKVHLPPLEAQRRIAEVLDKVSGLITKRREQLRKLDELVKARFVEMFGDFKLNTKNWPVVSFDEIAIIDGNMTTDYEKYANYPHVGIDSIEKETGALTGYRTVAEDGVISGKYLFTPKHIIYSKIRPNLNKVALPNFNGLCSADSYPILPIEGKCNRIFLAYDMRSQFFLDYILQFCNRTNLPKVNRKEVSGFKTPLPPIELQNKFATFVEQTDKSKLAIQQSLDKLEVLKKALMQQYFG